MPMTTQYQALIAEWEAQLEDLEVLVFDALKKAYPEGRTRRQLIFDVYHELVPNTVDLNNNKKDRKIRLTIGKLRDENLIPIVSSSGGAGYRLDLSEEAIVGMIEEWARRVCVFQEKVQRGHVMRRRIHELGEQAIPAQLEQPMKQATLWQE